MNPLNQVCIEGAIGADGLHEDLSFTLNTERQYLSNEEFKTDHFTFNVAIPERIQVQNSRRLVPGARIKIVGRLEQRSDGLFGTVVTIMAEYMEFVGDRL